MNDIQNQLHNIRLGHLKENMEGAYDEKRKKIMVERVRLLIENALFLKEDETRRRKWLNVLNDLDDEFLERLSSAIIRENLRYKKKKRDIVVELNTQKPPNTQQQT